MSDINALAGAFCPLNGPNASTVAIAATAASQTVALPQSPNAGTYNVNGTTLSVAPPGGGAKTFCVDNTGAVGLYVFVSFGITAGQAAATISTGATPGSYPCGPGKTVITVQGNPQFVGVIASGAGPTNVYITPGDGKL